LLWLQNLPLRNACTRIPDFVDLERVAMTEIRSAFPQLLALAAEMRPDWDQDDLRGALASAQGNGWSFGKACLAAVRLLVKPGTEARDLLAEVASPLAAKPGPQMPVDVESMPEIADALAACAEASAAMAERAGESR
jgi:hypothetical protein